MSVAAPQKSKPIPQTAAPIMRPIKQPVANDPLTYFLNPHIAVRIYFLLTILFALLAIAGPLLTMHLMKQQQYVAVLGTDSSATITPLLDYSDAVQLQEESALFASLALLSRNPTGPDYPDLLKKMFVNPGYDQAIADLESDKAEYSERQMRQKVDVNKVTILKAQSDRVFVLVEGQLFRTGIFKQEQFSEPPFDFELRLTFARNPRIMQNRRYPLVAYTYQLKILNPEPTATK